MFKGIASSPGSEQLMAAAADARAGTFFREAFCQPESEETMENIAAPRYPPI